MAWNEPGKQQDNDKEQKKVDKDPWSGNDHEAGPPDLDEVFANLKRRLGGVFGGGGGGDTSTPEHQGGGMVGVGLVLVTLLVIWALSGIFIVRAGQEAVVLRFGKYERTVEPGPHWLPRFIESEYAVNTQQIHNFAYPATGQTDMLTRDENIVSVAVAVQYRISNPRDYLFNVVSPANSLQQATASALRQVVGNMTLDDVLTTGREGVRQQVRDLLVKIVDIYDSGLEITDVNLQPAKAPDAVKDAFDDAIKAREDEQRFINQAQAYARGVEPRAEGQAKRIRAEAHAYKESTIADAEGNTSRFAAILKQYKVSPAVTRERLYLDAMQAVLGHSSKIVVDAKGNNLLYLPLDKILDRQKQRVSSDADDESGQSYQVSRNTTTPLLPNMQSNTGMNSRSGNGIRSNLPSRDDFSRQGGRG